jgi:ATP synthase protein I
MMPVDSYSSESDDSFAPLNREQAAQLRQRMPMTSPWRVVGAQVLVGALLAFGAGALWGSASLAWSVAFGALTVVVPAAVFARGLTGKLNQLNAGTAVFGFFLWEMVKIALTVAMLASAPRLIENLSWPGLLTGLIVTIKVYLGASYLRPKRTLP